uniref:Retrovirus-related Pol polyprotein from transposon TNT 1-94 n=1 Tax=Tanacetum cinerariifolium TaxID=118510 RepID=A0A6L2L1I6_TANCI|nr:retrovirus-related Pol polyprotein from transposon TNT 1-94 [Tanacetum cinerariifolium]
MNKKDEHGITIKNKARLVTQSYSQEEGIDYDETFTLVVRMEAIRIFLAFATYMNFKVYQMDVKSAFMNDKLKEEVYVKQPLGFESSEFTEYVYKLDKALYGLKQAPKAWYETLSTFLIQNKFTKGRIDNTLFIYKSKGDALLVQVSSVKTTMVPPNNLGLDLAGKPVNETSYMGMIGILMYLTATRPDIQFSTVLCARYQSNPKESHLTAMKRILSQWLCPEQKLNMLLLLGVVLSVVYQNFIREFWSTTVANHPFASTDETEQCPLKEFLIKLDYNNGKYAAHPIPEAVKEEVSKIAINLSYLDKTPVLKNSFPVAWRILFTFVIQGPEAFRALSKKSKKPKSKKPPTETKVTPPKPTEGFEQSHSVSSGTVPDPQDIKRNIQLTSMGLPFTLDEGTRKSQPFPEGTAKTTPHPEGSLGDKDLEGNITPADIEPIHPTVADLLGTGAKYQDELDKDSDEEEMLAAGDNMDEDPQVAKEVRTSSPKQDQPEPSYDQTDKLVESTMNTIVKSSTTIKDIYQGLNVITLLLKDINNAVKDDLTTNKKLDEAIETFAKIFTNTTEVLSLFKDFNFSTLQSTVKDLQAHALKQKEVSAAWTKSSTNMAWNLSSRMTAIEIS